MKAFERHLFKGTVGRQLPFKPHKSCHIAKGIHVLVIEQITLYIKILCVTLRAWLHNKNVLLKEGLEKKKIYFFLKTYFWKTNASIVNKNLFKMFARGPLRNVYMYKRTQTAQLKICFMFRQLTHYLRHWKQEILISISNNGLK